MQDVAFTMKLKPGNKDEYKRRHDEIWPELSSLLKEQGVSDYSIYLEESTNTLFAFQRVDPAKQTKELATLAIMKNWWNYMADIMETNQDNSPCATPLERMFYMA